MWIFCKRQNRSILWLNLPWYVKIVNVYVIVVMPTEKTNTFSSRVIDTVHVCFFGRAGYTQVADNTPRSLVIFNILNFQTGQPHMFFFVQIGVETFFRADRRRDWGHGEVAEKLRNRDMQLFQLRRCRRANLGAACSRRRMAENFEEPNEPITAWSHHIRPLFAMTESYEPFSTSNTARWGRLPATFQWPRRISK